MYRTAGLLAVFTGVRLVTCITGGTYVEGAWKLHGEEERTSGHTL
jgi:hypothetical protein